MRREDFAFDLPLFLNSEPPDFRNRGELRLTFERQQRRGGRKALRYAASGPALDGKTGSLWFDARDGRLVEARLPLPNHTEYRDFRLRLVKAKAGEQAWRAALADHWKGCGSEQN